MQKNEKRIFLKLPDECSSFNAVSKLVIYNKIC